jgi:hypothetical protein
MNRQCPRCGHQLSRWQYLGFYRIFSISCPGCRTLLALDDRGRHAQWGCILASLPCGLALSQWISPTLAYPVAVVAGFVAAVVVSAHVGRIGISPENEEDRAGI